jgi:hypothetical protein
VAATSTVGAWVRGSRQPAGLRAERLTELAAIVERLGPRHEPGVHTVWLNKPVPVLDDQKPLEVVAAGGYREVARVISELETPTFG